MHKSGLGILSIALALSGCGESEQLSAFKNVEACENTSLSTFLDNYTTSHQWQDGNTEAYGKVVGFVADMDFPAGQAKIGLQAKYQQSALDSTVYEFQPVAMELMKADSGQSQKIGPDIAFQMLNILCNDAVQKVTRNAGP